jgi:leucyl-tRNA synthetase
VLGPDGNKNDNELSSLEIQRDWMPVDLYFGGAEHTTMHVLYSRFWQKALFDLGLASTEEPYTRRINRGLVLGPDGNKMSKSKGNVIDPDEQVARLGADTVKMYLAFMGPYGETTNYPWNMGGIAGIRRFLERVNGLKDHVAVEEPSEITALLHRTIDKMTRDIENFKFNTCISALMIFINEAEKQGLTEATYRTFLTLLAPFAPHLTDELWEALGETSSIHVAVWPVANPALLTAETVTIAVSIDGKVRATIAIPYGASEDVARTAALTEKGIAERLEGKTITRVVYVPNKILNVITSS